MPTLRHFGTGARICVLIILFVLAIVTFREVGRNEPAQTGLGVVKRATITFDMPWNPPPKPEVKAIDPAAGGILEAVSKVAAALLNDGSNVANLAQSLTSSQTPTAATSVVSVVPDNIRIFNSGLDQATGIVGSIVSAATGIVGSFMSGTANAGATSSKTSGSGLFTFGSVNSSQAGATNASLHANLTSALSFNITSASNLTRAAISTAAPSATCSPVPSGTACPAPSTETCTVTETWHSTHYEETATFFNFVAASTITCTETVSVCPASKVYPLSPPSTSSQSGLVACADGVLARRAVDCPPTSRVSNNTASSPPIGSAIPAPNVQTGYSVLRPKPRPRPVLVDMVGRVEIVRKDGSVFLVRRSGTTAFSPSVPTTMAGFTARLPSLAPIPSLLPGIGLSTNSLQAFKTSPNGFTQAASANLASDVLSNAIGNVNSALGNINGLSGAVLSSVMGELSSAFGAANSAIGNANPTSIAAVTVTGGGLLSSTTGLEGGLLSNGAASGSNVAGGLIPTATSLVGDAAGGLVPSASATIGSVAGALQPPGISGLNSDVLSSVGAVLQSAGLSNAAAPLTSIAGGPSPQATAFIGSVVGALQSAGIAGLDGAILSSVVGALQSAGLPGLNLPQAQPPVTSPLLNNPGGLFRQVAQPSSATKDQPNVISHLTVTIQGTPTVLPVVITVLNGKPTVIPLVKILVGGTEKDMPVLGVDLGATGERVRVGAVAGVFDGAASGEKRRRNRIGGGEGDYPE
ncbi:hypothetical protein JHW43_005757 [Diplocarpon mali]|nr:hypothetical protein JHW43_005757 [Diplocarpon mali]